MLRRLPIAGLALLFVLEGPDRAQDAGDRQLLAQESSGSVEVTEETVVSIEGLKGKVSAYLGAAGSITFEARTLGSGSAPTPIAIWLDATGFRIAPVAGAEDRPVLLNLQVPPGLNVTFDGTDAKVTASSIRGSLLVRGARLDVLVEEGSGASALDLEASNARVARSTGTLSVRTRDTATTIVGWKGGPISLRSTGGSFTAQEVNEVEGEASETKVKLDGCHGAARLHAVGGSVEGKNLHLGGAFQMSRARLLIEQAHGSIDVESDSEVRFSNTETFRVHGAVTILGSRNLVDLEIVTDGAAISLDSLDGSAQVSGSNLRLALRHVGADTKLDVSSSEVTADDVSAPIEIVSEDSTVKVTNASQDLAIRSRGGDVQVIGQMGPATVHADGERVLFEWGALSSTKGSTVENEGGSIAMVFPTGAGVRVEAESRYGRIESEFPEIEVSSEGSKAAGSLGRANQSLLVRVVAERDITLASRKQGE